MDRPELSVVLLCYRAGNSLTATVDEVRTLLAKLPSYELILVANYDRESDTTPKIATELASQDSRIRYSALPKQGMMGWDMKSGLAMATGSYVVVIDGDGQMPYFDILRVYEAAKQSGAEVVKTYRTKRGDDAWRIVVSYIYNFLFWILFPGLPARDINSKPKLFTRSALARMRLESNDWFIDAEMMILARRYHFSIVEIPTVFNKLVGRRSYVKTQTVFEFLTNLIRFRIKEFSARD